MSVDRSLCTSLVLFCLVIEALAFLYGGQVTNNGGTQNLLLEQLSHRLTSLEDRLRDKDAQITTLQGEMALLLKPAGTSPLSNRVSALEAKVQGIQATTPPVGTSSLSNRLSALEANVQRIHAVTPIVGTPSLSDRLSTLETKLRGILAYSTYNTSNI